MNLYVYRAIIVSVYPFVLIYAVSHTLVVEIAMAFKSAWFGACGITNQLREFWNEGPTKEMTGEVDKSPGHGDDRA